MNRVKWHAKYACRPSRTDAALIHFPWRSGYNGILSSRTSVCNNHPEAGQLRRECGTNITDWDHFYPGVQSTYRGVDAHPGDLTVRHLRMAAMGQLPQNPEANCASVETREGKCGASGRTANPNCGLGWCCLVSCPFLPVNEKH